MRLTIRTAALTALLALGAASAGQAQTPGQASDDRPGRPPMAGQPSGQMRAQMQAWRETHERQRAQDLRTVLRLRPDQEPALTALLQSHRSPAPPRERAVPQAALTTPQRLDEMARRDTERAALRQRHVEALRAFYTALSSEQRQVFDALQRMQDHGPRDGRGGPGGWGRRGFGGPPRPRMRRPPARAAAARTSSARSSRGLWRRRCRCATMVGKERL